MKSLITIITYITNRSVELKNRYTYASTAPIEFACIFCQNKGEYNKFTSVIEKLGKIVEETSSGFTYLLDESLKTAAGPLRLVKIRKPDFRRERGDADFNTDYKKFKNKYRRNSRFELVKYETFEMLRLSDSDYDVMACFSNIPKSKSLAIKL